MTPVQKFKDIAEVLPASASKSRADDLRADGLRAAFDMSELASRLSRQVLDPGTRRFHSIEEATREVPTSG